MKCVESTRSGEMDATVGRNGGAQRTVWETLLEMESFKLQAGEEDPRAVALVLDLTRRSSESATLWVWAWATHFSFPRKILRVFCGYFEHRAVRRMSSGAAPDHHGRLARVKVELLASTSRAAGRSE